MRRALVIGTGNPLRGDDGLGWHVVQQLRGTLPVRSVELIVCHQLTPELAETIADASRVVFVDAAIGEKAGAIQVRAVSPVLGACEAFSHHLDPEALMRYAQRLYGSVPEAFVVSVGGESFDYSEALSDVARSSLSAVLPLLCDLALLRTTK
jgi:hydrogenase maturation protease